MSVRRIRIRADRGGAAVAVDVTLPSGAPVGELIPAIVAMIGDLPTPTNGWRLEHLTGGQLAESSGLQDNGIHDGDLVILAPADAPLLGVSRLAPFAEVVAARPTDGRAGPSPELVGVLAVVLAAVTLAWVGVHGHQPAGLIVAAVGAGLACTAAVTTGFPTTAAVTAVILCATTGFLVVPGGPAAPNVLLAAAAAFAASFLALRMSGRPSVTLWGTATYSALLAVATVATMPLALAGAVLAAGSLSVLALAPRIAVLTAGLGPEHWGGDELATNADAGQAVLTGLVNGCAAGAASGSALVGLADLRPHAPTSAAIAFPALVGLILLLRARIHDDPARRRPLVVAGMCCGTAALISVAAAYPHLVTWTSGGLIALALLGGRGRRLGPGLSRLADRLEYVALTIVIPMTLWVGGVYALVGEVHAS